MRYKNNLLASCLMAAMIASPAAVKADTNNSAPDPASVREIADHLSVFEQQAADVSRNAGDLLNLARNHRTAWESHAYYLNNLRHDINDLGRMLSELEQAKPQGSETQQMAIERARPHLVALAAETTEALDLLRVGNRNLRQTQYKETVAELSSQADILYQTVDTIVDYHNADDRLDKLEASHSGSGI
jgi:chromosome segregation ATPase